MQKAKKFKADQLLQNRLRRKAFSGWCEGIQMSKNRHRLLHQASSFNKLSMLSKVQLVSNLKNYQGYPPYFLFVSTLACGVIGQLRPWINTKLRMKCFVKVSYNFSV